MKVKIIECPRDAMQGLEQFIPTEIKAKYINQLLEVGFDTIDFGSFVSPKAIPQLRDTAEVLSHLDLSKTKTKLLAIIANERGADDALNFEEIDYLGYPFSISETFQMRNTNAGIEQSLKRVEVIQNKCVAAKKKLVIYISMAFGNPYGDAWSPDLATMWALRLHKELGVELISLADTVGVSNESNIKSMFEAIIPELPNAEIGAHLHSTPEKTRTHVLSAYYAGCKRFDSAINGFGGCPMANDDLVGNVATETLLDALPEKEKVGINESAFLNALKMANTVFPT